MEEKQLAEIIFYQTEDGQTNISVHFEGETAWLTQKKLAELFNVDRTVVTKHLKNIFSERELDENSVSAKIAHTASDGKRYITKYYNLDAIISVGYRVNSDRATKFRIWVTQKLREYIIKGFVLDDERMKQGGQKSRYFEELLQKVRDIRSSERNFYQKVTDIYATSIDYRKDNKLTEDFFATVQNKMHYAIHGHTAAEIIAGRANSKKPMMGLTNFKGKYVTAEDVKIAKNYLSQNELNQLNLIVSLYLDFAELQATNERPMKMIDWITKLDQFLKLSEKRLLTNSGKISAKTAKKKATTEFDKYRKSKDIKYISDFDNKVKKLVRHEKN